MSSPTDTPRDHRLAALLERLYRQNESVIKLGLDAMRDAFDLAGNPHRSAPHVLVGGTNGKGTTAATLAALATARGARAGLFTSPHLVHFSERIRVDGACIPDDELARIGSEVLEAFAGTPPRDSERVHPSSPPLLRAPLRPLTFFELAALMAARYFQERACDLVVYEVGLGGRLDATNATDPVATVVTNIALDHQMYLGESLPEIGGEKAGIFRAGVPAILGSRDDPGGLRTRASDVGAPVWQLGRDFEIVPGMGLDHTPAVFRGFGRTITLSGQGATPRHTLDNLAAAIATSLVLEQAGHLALAHDACIARGVGAMRWPGRFHLLTREMLAPRFGDSARAVVLDAAHNPAAAEVLARAWSAWLGARPYVLALGALSDKDVSGIWTTMTRACPAEQTVVLPIHSSRASSPTAICAALGLPVQAAATSVEEGLLRAFDALPADGMVLVTGSIYLLGEVLETAGLTHLVDTTYERASE